MATEILLDEHNLCFRVQWRDRYGTTRRLIDGKTAKPAVLLPMFEVPANPFSKFDNRTAHALLAKFEHVDAVFREHLA